MTRTSQPIHPGSQTSRPKVSSHSFLSFFLLTILLVPPSICTGAELTLNWTANMVADYKIYFGTNSRFELNSNLKTNFQYDIVINLKDNQVCTPGIPTSCTGLPTTDLNCTGVNTVSPTCTIKNLTPNQLYFFAATASNATIESPYSAEVNELPHDTAVPAPYFSTAEFPNQEGIRGTVSFDSNWNSVVHNSNIANPVIITGPASSNDADMGINRLQNITKISFEIKYQEGQYLAASNLSNHPFEETSFMVLQKGIHYMNDGSIWEAGTFETDSAAGAPQWQGISFTANASTIPYLFLTIQTNNESDPVIIRVKNLTASGFSTAMFEAEISTDGHSFESIGYLAVFTPVKAGELSGPAGFSPYRFAKTKAAHNFTPTLGKEIQLQEDQSKDLEISHTLEDINSLEIDTTFFSQATSCYGKDPFVIRQRPSFYSTTSVTNQWYTVPMSHSLTNPVIIVGVPTYTDTDPGVIRISNISPASFDMKFQEWSYLNAKNGGTHQLEDVAWMALDPGLYPMPDGSYWEIGTFQISGTGISHGVFFDHIFAEPPTLFLTMQTYNGGDPATTRASNITRQGFNAALYEEEAKMSSGHATETIGYLAIHNTAPAGSGDIDGQEFSYSVSTASTNHNYTTVSNMKIIMQEEQSLDLETFHSPETVNTLALNNALFAQDISSIDDNPASIRLIAPDTNITPSTDTDTDGVDLANFIQLITDNPTATVNLQDFSNIFGQ